LPSHISGDYTVRMLLDKGGQVHRVWILTPRRGGDARAQALMGAALPARPAARLSRNFLSR
jgi:hypothetical protein